MIMLAAILCLGLRGMGCGPADRPIGCIIDNGKRYEIAGQNTAPLLPACMGNEPCQFIPYNQAAKDDEFEKEREVCRGKKCKNGECTPIS